MARQNYAHLAAQHHIPLDVSFYALDSDTVRRVLDAADSVKYRQPANANGSRARYFHARLKRDAAK